MKRLYKNTSSMFKIVFLAFLILNINYSLSQTVYTIGSGTTTTYLLPINNFYGYSYNQSIYPAANLTAQGMTAGMQITQIAWYINAANAVGTTNNNNWTIYLGNTPQSAFATTTNWVPTASMTQVYSGNVNTWPTGWVTVTLQTPFTWTGGNLVVACDENNASYTWVSTMFRYTAGAANSSIIYYSDFTNPNPAAPPTASGRNTYLPNIQLTAAAAAACSGTPNAGTANISAASGCGGANFTLTGTGLTSGVGISYQWQSGPTSTGPWTNIIGATAATLTTSTTSTTFYRLVTTCANSGLTNNSNAISYTPTPGTCFIQFNLTDSYGDGWNGATMNFIVNGSSYATIGSTFTTGSAQTLTYCIPQNSTYSLVYTNGGSFPGEVGISAMIVSGTTVYSVGAGGAAVGATMVSGVSCPLPCAGTPTPGNTISSSPSTTPGGTVNLSLQSSGGTGITYQWQSGPTSTGPWTNIGGATSSTYTATVNNITWYQCIVTCTNSGQAATSNPVQVILAQCTPSGSTGYYLTSVSTTGGATNFTNPTGASAGGYGNYSNSISCSNITGTPTNITLTSNFGSDLFFCWIDWNNDLDFLDANEAVFASSTYAASYTGVINIPVGTTNGTYRMRVANSYIGSAPVCGPNSWGEYEDYSFIVLSNCNGTPPAPTASITGATPICYGSTTTLNGTVSAIYGGVSYQWGMSNTAGGPYTNVTGGNALSYTTSNSLAPGTYYFVVNSNCSFSGQNSSSNEISITVNGASSNFSMNPASFCGAGGSSALSANPPAAGASYTWSSNGPSLSTNSGVATNATLASTGEITLSATLNGCTSTTTQSIGVYSFPSITPTATPSTICGGTSSLLETGLSASNFAAICIAPAPLAIPPTASYLVNNGVASQALSSGSLDDGGWGAIPLGFNFNFFGTNYSNINVGTNGVLQFGAYNALALGDFIIGALPNNVDPMGAIYGCANDLHCGYAGANVRYWTSGAAPNRKFVVNYQVFQFGGTTTPVNFQVILYETLGQVDIVATQIMSTNPKSIGVNSPNGTIGAAAPNCAAIPNTANYWSAQTATIAAGSPQAWKFLPPINYTYNWSVNGVANPNNAQLNGASVTTTSTTQSPVSTTNYQVYIQDPITQCSQVFQTPVTVIPTPAAPTATNWTQCGPQVPQASVSCPTCTGNQTYNWYTAATNGTLFQGVINETFNTGTTTGTLYGNATIVNSRCRLTNDAASENGALLLGSTGVNSNAYNIDFDFRVGPSDALGYNGADGFSYSFGDDVNATAPIPAAENGSGSKLKVGFVSYTNGASTAGIYLMYNCTTDEQTPITPGVLAYSSNIAWKNTNSFNTCNIVINASGQVTLSINGTAIFSNVQLPANYLLQNKSTWLQLFKARTGAGFSRHMIDNVHVEAQPVQSFNTIQQTVSNTVTYYVQTLDGICGSQTMTPVTVTVNPAPAVGISSNFNGCQYGSYPVAVNNGQNSYSTFTWSPAGLLYLDSLHTTPYTAGTSATNLWFYAGASGVQPTVTMTAQDNGVGALQCSQSAVVVATLQAAPTSPIIAAANALICSGATTTLSVQAGGTYCSSIAGSTSDEEITNVSIGSLNNTSDCSTPAPGAGSILSRYANYTSGAGAPASPTYTAGSTVSGTVTVGSCGAFNYTSGLAIFIDLNQDGDFVDAGEKVFSNGAASNIACVPATIQSVSLTIPANALNGQTRMRIINAESYSGDIITPCLNPGYGETEDYLVTIVGGVSNTYVWAAAVAGNSTAPTVTTNPINASTNYTATLFDGTCYSAPSNQVTVSIAGNPTITATASVPVGGYCVPPMSFGCSFPDIISNVTIAGINNSTLCNNTSGANGYSFFNNLTGNLTAGTNNIPYSVTTDGDVEGAAMWIDFNQNGTFEASENIFNGIIGTAPATYAGTFNVPANAVNGPTRMRVRCMYNNNPGAGGACSAGSFGETEDYTVNITGGINNIPCPGSTFNLVSMVANGGQPFTYSWSVLSGNATLSSSTAQNPTSIVNSDAVFQVTMTDNCGAVSTTTVSANIDENPITATPVTNVICAYDSVALSASNGINYSWSPSASLTSGSAALVQAFPLTNTSYTVTGGYGNGCIGTATATVNVNALPVVTANANQTICAGTAVTLNGGGAVSYSWNNGVANSSSFIPLNTATYTVNGVDANGCHNTAQTTITVNPLPIVSSTANQAICIGSSITLTGSGASTYVWDNGVLDGVAFNPNTTGTYTVIGTDLNGCTNSAQTQIIVNALPLLNVTPSNVLCYGGSGSVILSATGVAPFTYGGSSTQGLLPGTYTYTATSYDGCVSVPVSINISQPAAALSLSTLPVDVLCFGNNTGSVDLTVNGGTFPYGYAWSNNASTEDVFNLNAGNYSVLITDANGCTLNTAVNIAQPAAALNLTTTQVNVDCFGNNTGTIDLTTTGGTSQYAYNWSNNTSNEDPSALLAGNYSVLVTDAHGCTANASILITEPQAPLILTSSQINVGCFGNATGSIDLTPAGGTAQYTYAWSNNANNQDLVSLLAGTYTVLVTDAQGCTANASINISQPAAALSLSTLPVDVLCFGNNTGSVDLTVNGGTFPYGYAWSNNASTEDVFNLNAGNYSVLITDANGCTLNTAVNIAQPAAALNLTTTQVNVDCFGNNTGSINLTPTGGTSQYAFAWSNNTSNEDPSVLPAGNYSVLVTDAHGCTATTSITISEPAAPLTLSTTQINVDCFGNNTGSVDLSPSGGTQQYTYAWSNNASSQDLTGLIAGQYNVLVTDVQGCTATTSVTVSEPAASLSLSTVPVDVLCYGNNTGSIDLIVAGGTGPFGYAWSNNSNTEDIVNLIAGSYNVVVTDNNGCTFTTNAVVNQPLAPLTLTATQANMGCFSSGIGSINLTPAGGSIPYNFAWSNNTTLEDPTNLAAGNYNVLVTDAHGCTNTIQQTVLEYALPNVNAGPNVAICIGNNVTLNGTGAQTYTWNNGVINGVSFSPNSTNTYTLTGVDANGCVNTDQVLVTVNSLPIVNPGNNATLCAGSILVLHATGATTYTWSNGIVNGAPMVANTSGTLTVIGVDNNGCIDTAQLTLTVNTPPVVTLSGGNLGCQLAALNLTASSQNTFGGIWSTSNGLGTFTPNVSNPTLSYIPSATDPATVNFSYTAFNQCGTTITNTSASILPSPTLSTGNDVTACAGTNVVLNAVSNAPITWTNNVTNGVPFTAQNGTTTYQATATGINGCTNTDYVNVNGLPVPFVDGGNDQTVCAGESVVLYATGTITYVWNNGVVNNQPFVPASTGVYTVTGTGQNGCSNQDNVTINVNAIPNANAISTDPVTIVASPAGMSYQWYNCATNQNIIGADNDSLVATANGSYAVIVTNANGCSDTSNCIVVDQVGLFFPSSAVISLYPNPTDGMVTLELPAQEGAIAMIYDAQGKLIFTSNNAKNGEAFDLSKLTTGVYTFRIQLNNLIHIEKIVKN